MGRNANKAERERFDKLYELGCIVCRNEGKGFVPTAVHHIDGQSKKGAHLKTIPLCGRHHQIKDNQKPKRWISIHGDGKKPFEQRYGTQYELLEQVNNLINE